MFGTKLKQLRKDNGLSQEKLAKQLNHQYNKSISKSMISRWESNKTDPQMTYVRLIADFFNKESAYFFPEDREDITDAEKMLDIYKKLDEYGKKIVLKTALLELERKNLK